MIYLYHLLENNALKRLKINLNFLIKCRKNEKIFLYIKIKTNNMDVDELIILLIIASALLKDKAKSDEIDHIYRCKHKEDALSYICKLSESLNNQGLNK